MKSPTHLLIAAAAAVGASFLLAQESEKKPDPRPAGDGNQPFPPAERRNDGERPPGRGDRPPRQDGFFPGEGERRPEGLERPQRRPEGQGDRPFRPNGGPDGDRPFRPDGPQDGRDGERPPFPPGGRPGALFNQNAPLKLQAYLGVVTRPAPAEMNVQLKQPEGFGLVVDDVLDESPAKTGGLLQNDLLRQFDDQLLANPAQLEALVRRAGKDKEVSLTILREGAEQKLTVKIGEKMLPIRRPLASLGGYPDNQRDPFPGRENGGQPRRDGSREPGTGRGDFRDQPGAAAPLDRQTRYATERARVLRRDESGRYDITRANGHRVLTATRPDGTVAWKGPVDTEEERQAIPEDIRKKFDEIEKSRPLDRLGDRPGQPDQPNQPGGPRPQRPAEPPPPPASEEPTAPQPRGPRTDP